MLPFQSFDLVVNYEHTKLCEFQIHNRRTEAQLVIRKRMR